MSLVLYFRSSLISLIKEEYYGCCGFEQVTIRAHEYVPLDLCTAHAGALPRDRVHENTLRKERRRDVPQDGEVLGQVIPDQLCTRHRHRHHPGIPVRNELGRVFEIRR